MRNLRYAWVFPLIVSACFTQKDDNSAGTASMRFAEISTGTVSYYPDRREYVGYVAKPVQEGKYPGLILIHEYWGLDSNTKKLAEDFARQGYVTIAVDLYWLPGTENQEEASRRAASVRENTAQAFANLGYAVAYLKWLPEVDNTKLGAVGWCFGGGWAYEMAKNNLGTRVSVMYYGRFSPEDDLSMMKSHILGHFGEADASIPVDTVREFQARLKNLSGENAIYIYPNAGHAFANKDRPSYDPEAADLAWKRTLDFLSKEFK